MREKKLAWLSIFVIICFFIGVFLFADVFGTGNVIVSSVGFWIFVASIAYLIICGLYKMMGKFGILSGCLITLSVISLFMLVGTVWGLLAWPPYSDELASVLLWIGIPPLILGGGGVGYKLVLEKDGSISIRSFREHRSIPMLFTVVIIGLSIIAAGVTLVVNYTKDQTYLESVDKIKVEITDKELDEKGNFVIPVMLTNNTTDTINDILFELEISDSENDILVNTSFHLPWTESWAEDESKTFYVTVDKEHISDFDALQYIDYKYLSVRLKITQVYFDGALDPYDFDHLCFQKEIDSTELANVTASAEELFNSGSWEEAKQIFVAIGNFDMANQCDMKLEEAEAAEIEATRNAEYQNAISLYNNGNYEQAKTIFEELFVLYGYKDSEEWIAKCDKSMADAVSEEKYINAKSLYANHEYQNAYKAFKDIQDYKDSADYIAAIASETKELAEAAANIGDYSSALNYLLIANSDSSLCTAYTYAKDGMYGNAVKYGLTKIVIKSGETTINQQAFLNCTELVEIVIPDTVTSIQYAAFSGCTSLKKVTMSSKIQTIGMEAFKGCTLLEELRLPVTLTQVDWRSFKGSGGNLYYAGTMEQWMSIEQLFPPYGPRAKTVYCSDGELNP